MIFLKKNNQNFANLLLDEQMWTKNSNRRNHVFRKNYKEYEKYFCS